MFSFLSLLFFSCVQEQQTTDQKTPTKETTTKEEQPSKAEEVIEIKKGLHGEIGILPTESLKSPTLKGSGSGLGLNSIGVGGTGVGSISKKKLIPLLKLSEPTITGDGNPEVIHSYVRRRQSQIKYCYDRELQKDPNVKGKMTVGFDINVKGQVLNAQKKSSSLNSEAVEKCVIGKIKRFKFPENQTATVEYSILFSIK